MLIHQIYFPSIFLAIQYMITYVLTYDYMLTYLHYSLQRPEYAEHRMKMGKAKSFNQLKKISQDLKDSLLVSFFSFLCPVMDLL